MKNSLAKTHYTIHTMYKNINTEKEKRGTIYQTYSVLQGLNVL